MNGLNKFLYGAIALIFSTNLCAQNAEIQLVRRIESPVISETGPCTREILQKAADSYIEAQAAGDLSKMSFAPQVRYIENMKEVTKEQGLWNTTLPIAFHRSFLDVVSCRTFTEVIVTEGDHPYVIGTRLRVENGKISEIDSIVTDEGDWLFNAEDYLKYSKTEDWGILPSDQRSDRQTPIDAANSYLDFFSDKTIEVPWGYPCTRIEGGLYTGKGDPEDSCDIGIPENILIHIIMGDFVVDVDRGSIDVYSLMPIPIGTDAGMPDSHLFRLFNGKLQYVHSLTVAEQPPADP